jgi:hypothetical protein
MKIEIYKFLISLIWLFIVGLYLLPQPIFAEIISAPDTIRVSVGGEVSGEVKMVSAKDGSCLKAMSAKGPMPVGVRVDFTPECGEGNWNSNYKVKVNNNATPGTYQIGFVEIPKSGPPAISVKQVKLSIIAASYTPSPPLTQNTPTQITEESTPTTTPVQSSRAFLLSPLFTTGIFLVTLLGLYFLLGNLRRSQCKRCNCEEIKIEKGKSPVTASIDKKRFLFCQKCDFLLDQQTKFCDRCVKFQKSTRQEEIPYVKIIIPATYAIKCEQTKATDECVTNIVSYVKSKEWKGATLEKDITIKGLPPKLKQGMPLQVANEKIDPLEVKRKGKCDGKLPRKATDWNLNYEAAIVTGERESRVGIDEQNPLRGKLTFEIVGGDCIYSEALEVEIELTFTQFKQTGMEGLDKRGNASVGVKTKGFFKKWEKGETPEDYEKKEWTPKKEK